MNAFVAKRTLAAALFAGAFSSTLLFAPARAQVFGFGDMPHCMNEQALKEIAQLEGLEKSYQKWIATIQQAIPIEQQKLKDTEAELQQAVQILAGGAANYPAGFDQQSTVDKLIKTINFLVASIDDDEQRQARLTQELTSVQLRLREEKMLGPCDASSSTTGGGGVIVGGGEMIDTNDLLNGPPVTPPVLADPSLLTPDPVIPGFNPAKPQDIPGFNPAKPLDGLIDPPVKKVDKWPLPKDGPEPPQVGMTTPRGADIPASPALVTRSNGVSTENPVATSDVSTPRSFAGHDAVTGNPDAGRGGSTPKSYAGHDAATGNPVAARDGSTPKSFARHDAATSNPVTTRTVAAKPFAGHEVATASATRAATGGNTLHTVSRAPSSLPHTGSVSTGRPEVANGERHVHGFGGMGHSSYGGFVTGVGFVNSALSFGLF